MINHSSSVNTQATTAVQADVKSSQQLDISSVVDTEVKQVEKAVTQVNAAEQLYPEQTKTPEMSHEKVEEAVASLNAFVQLMDRNVSFEIDDNSGRDVISVFEKETKELIRQIPSEETLALLERMDKMVGILFNDQV